MEGFHLALLVILVVAFAVGIPALAGALTRGPKKQGAQKSGEEATVKKEPAPPQLTGEELKAQQTKDAREAVVRRIARLFSRIDYEERGDAYHDLSKDTSGKHAEAIVASCNYLIVSAAILDVLPRSTEPIDNEQKDVWFNLQAYLYFGLRQDACILLREAFKKSGVPVEMVDEAFDLYESVKPPPEGFISKDYDGD